MIYGKNFMAFLAVTFAISTIYFYFLRDQLGYIKTGYIGASTFCGTMWWLRRNKIKTPKEVFLLPLLILTALPIPGLANSNADYIVHEKSFTQAINAISFSEAQSITLDRISSQHATLSQRAGQLQAVFNSKYNYPDAALRFLTAAGMSQTNINETLQSLRSKATVIIDEKIPQDAAEAYLDEVADRIQGQFPIYSIKQTLLWLKYASQPSKEFSDGFVNRLISRAHLKSAGVNFSILAPISWEQRDGEGAHILHSWTIQGGNGFSNISIQIRDTGSPKIAKSIVDPRNAIEVAEGLAGMEGSVLSIRLIDEINQEGLIVYTSEASKVENASLQFKYKYYLIVNDASIFAIGCKSLLEGDPDLDAKRFKDVEEVCDLMAESLDFSN